MISERATNPRGDGFDGFLRRELQSLDEAGLGRELRPLEAIDGTVARLDGRDVVLFCSNDYLGLAQHSQVVAAAQRALERFGASTASSRLVCGSTVVHRELETSIARWKGCEAAVTFSTGYQANVGVITALLGPRDLVLSDELNHASLIDGCRLSRAQMAIYRHGDVEHLEWLLRRAAPARRTLVLTESVFSMDGDQAPLEELARTAQRAGAWLMVDEAHAVGVFGEAGAGLVNALGLACEVEIQMGTLGKALGSFGAYVAGSRSLVDVLVNTARPFLFTTALPPAAVAAAQAAMEVCRREPRRASGLLERARGLGLRLRAAGLEVPSLDSQILAAVVGDSRRATALAAGLLRRGYYVPAIRPPTVPDGTSRLRLSLSASHTEAQIDGLVTALAGSLEALS